MICKNVDQEEKFEESLTDQEIVKEKELNYQHI